MSATRGPRTGSALTRSMSSVGREDHVELAGLVGRLALAGSAIMDM